MKFVNDSGGGSSTSEPLDNSKKESIVISGLAGRYPDCDSIAEFWHKLVNGIELSSIDDRRWPPGYLALPNRAGKIRDISKLDYQFFGMTEHEANYTDAQMRIALETTYEALADAGLDPGSLRGSKTAVFAGICYDDTGTAYGQDESTALNYLNLSVQRITTAFDFRGGAFTADTACASSFSAFCQAFYSLKAGLCDQAVVVGAAINLRPTIALGFNNLRMTSQDGRSKCMDASADGYGRSEAVVSIILQRESKANRVYAKILNTKTNTDGYKTEGITYPSVDSQYRLMSSTMKETGIDPLSIKYIEAHMTGTPAGDVVESESIRRSFCEGRKEPLLMGCLKSNLGHTEGASGCCALSKVCLAFEHQELPPNLNFNEPNLNIDGLRSGILKPVIERTPFKESVVGVSSFGFGGCNVYSLLKANEIAPSDDSFKNAFNYKVPRLVLLSGRTKSAVEYALTYIHDNESKATNEFFALLNQTMSNKVQNGMSYRGYKIYDSSNCSSVQLCKTDPQPVWLALSGVCTKWIHLPQEILTLEPVASSLQESIKFAESLGINLANVLYTKRAFDVTLAEGMVSIAAIQIALVDLLKCLQVNLDGIIGHSIGEIVCAYADGGLSREQSLATAYFVAKNLMSITVKNGSTGLEWDEIGVHTDKIKNIFSEIRDSLDKHVFKGKTFKRTSRWIPTFNAETAIDTSQLTPEYFAQAFTSKIAFRETLYQLPKNAAVIEIAPQPMLEAALRKGLGPDATFIPLLNLKSERPSVRQILQNLGSLYATGNNLKIESLYPPVTYPVPRGTLSISPMIQWDHSKSCTVTKYPEYFQVIRGKVTYDIDLMQSSFQYLGGHTIDGRNLCPAVEYLRSAWESIVANNFGSRNFMDYPIEFRRVRFSRGIMLSNHKPVEITCRYQKDTGAFETLESGNLCCSGYAYLCDDSSTDYYESLVSQEPEEGSTTLDSKSIYKELRVRGYDYGPSFQGIVEASSDGCHGRVKWMGQWVSFVDSMLQIAIVGSKARELRIPTFIEYVKCDPKTFMANIEASRDEMGESIVDVHFDREIGVGVSKGMVLMGLKTSAISRRNAQTPVIESYTHSPFIETKIAFDNDKQSDLETYINNCERLSTLVGKENLSQSEEKQFKEIRSCIKDPAAPRTSVLALLSESLSRLHPETIEKSEESADETTNEPVTDKKEFLSSQFASLKEKYSADKSVMSGIENERVTRHQIELVMENIVGRSMRLLEMNRTTISLSSEINELLSANLIQPDYTLLHSNPSSKLISSSGATNLVDWTKFAEKSPNCIPDDLNDMDLIMYKDDSTDLFVNSLYDIQKVLEESIGKLKAGGFILLFYRTNALPIEKKVSQIMGTSCLTQLRSHEVLIQYAKELNLSLVSCKQQKETNVSSLLLRKPLDILELKEVKVLPVDTFSYGWIEDVKTFLLGPPKQDDKKEESKEDVAARRDRSKRTRLWITSNDKSSGVVGLVKCLRKEPGCEAVRCLYDPTSPNAITQIPNEILERDLVITTMDTSTKLFGTMRHSILEVSETKKPSNHAYVDIKTKGDMSSFRWLENSTKYFSITPESCKMSANESIVQVHYSALNFKDVMIASGRISTEAYPSGLGVTGGMLGMEFSGTDENGNRVMGYAIGKGMATEVSVLDPFFLWPVPQSWSLRDAATVPVVYATVYYALFIRGRLLPGSSILIHSGAGGVGQAAINICQSIGCKIFTTCSDAKREFLKAKFGLKDNQIANSRDLTFEEHILKETGGHGVDMILNSLSEGKLKASINCLGEFGRFIEIGKYDILVNNPLDLSRFGRNQAFETVCLAHLDFAAFIDRQESSLRARKLVYEMMCKGIEKGVIKPLDSHVYPKEQVEEAFRFMASGKHTGKVLLQVRPEEEDFTSTVPLIPEVIQQTLFIPNKSYIIVGGLGGFGLELTYWMVTRGAKKIILTSRTGIKENYQAVFLQRMQEISFGQIEVSTDDITTEQGALNLIEKAKSMGKIGGIFNLAMVLTDAALENQNEDSFDKCCKPKVHATHLLDKLSRTHCPSLDHFVCFSSIVSGRGNPGQTNYGFANNFMEQICQNRLNSGLPGLAIQWGAIGDVGVVAELLGGNDVVIAGTSVPQRIHSCLDTLDQLMAMSNEGCAVVSSVVRASANRSAHGGGKGDLLGTICHILGIKDPSSLDPNSTLSELGMDSLMAIEIKQGLEREFDVVLSTQEIRSMTVKRLREMQAEIAAKGGGKAGGKGPAAVVENAKVTFDEILNLPKGNLCRLNNSQAGKPVICFAPIEGSYRSLVSSAKYVSRPMIGLNWTEEAAKIGSLKDVAAYYVHLIKQNFQDNQYDLLGYDFGGLLALEVAAQLQLQFGDHACKKVGVIESSPDLMKCWAEDIMMQAKTHPNQDIDPLYNLLLVEYVKAFFEIEKNESDQMLESLSEFKNDREKKLTFISNVFNNKVERSENEESSSSSSSSPSSSSEPTYCDAASLASAVDRFYKKVQFCSSFTSLSRPKMPLIIGLQKAAEPGIAGASKLDASYNLSKIQTAGLELAVHVLQGDHRTALVIDPESLGVAIDSFFLSVVCA